MAPLSKLAIPSVSSLAVLALAAPAAGYHCPPGDASCSGTPHPPIVAPDPGGNENTPLFPLPSGKRFGFNEVYNPEFDSAEGKRMEADLEYRAGANIVRTTFDWPVLEPQKDVWDEYQWRWRREAVDRRKERGIKTVIILLHTPSWAKDAGCVEPCPPSRTMLTQWRQFAAEVARRFPDAAGIEVWNEPNLHWFWGQPDPPRYVELLREGYQAIKAARRAMPVVGGSLSGNIGWQDGDWPIGAFLEQAYAAGMKSYMNVLSFHPYPVETNLGANSTFAKAFDDVRKIKSRYGDAARRIWADETGHTTTGSQYALSPQDQARELMRLSRKLMSMSDVDVVVIHTPFEPRNYPMSSPERGYGLMLNESSTPVPKPAYCAFVSAAGRTHPACATSASSTTGTLGL